MVRMIGSLRFTALVLMTALVAPAYASDAEQPNVAEAQDWVFESVVENGELQFTSFHDWADTQSMDYRPLTIFVDGKLGCKTPISLPGIVDDLANDWFIRMSVASRPLSMKLIDGRYVVAEGHRYKEAVSKGLIILDIENRWSAFAMNHGFDYWRFEDGGWQSTRYSEEHQRDYHPPYFSLFLPDPSSDAFALRARQLTRTWIEGYGFGGKPGFGSGRQHRLYADGLPIQVYEVRCGNAD